MVLQQICVIFPTYSGFVGSLGRLVDRGKRPGFLLAAKAPGYEGVKE
jgi:hypothetical protein